MLVRHVLKDLSALMSHLRNTVFADIDKLCFFYAAARCDYPHFFWGTFAALQWIPNAGYARYLFGRMASEWYCITRQSISTEAVTVSSDTRCVFVAQQFQLCVSLMTVVEKSLNP